MAGSRTIKSLTILVMAMTLGTFVLMFLERQADPLKPPTDYLAAPRAATEAGTLWQIVPRPQPAKWQYVMVHTTSRHDDPLVDGSHFVISPAGDGGFEIVATSRWQNQQDGRHVDIPGGDYNASSIGVCVVGDFSSQPPAAEQFDLLVWLVRQLQRDCDIAHGQVFLWRDERREARDHFPAGRFQRLIASR